MQWSVTYMAALLFLFSSTSIAAKTKPIDSAIDIIIDQLVEEIVVVKSYYEVENEKLFVKISMINKELKQKTRPKYQLRLLLKKNDLEAQLNVNNLSEATEISKIRYLKGLQIIKILYDKTLSLDHHFSSVATFNEINDLSNPNHYPEFTKLKETIKSKAERKRGFGLSELLGENIYTSVMHSLMSLFTNSKYSKEEKEANLEAVECILDFTLRMHNDLNTIYFETAFLQKSNDNIIDELEQLFSDFTKPINYRVALKECRNNDDWDRVREHLNGFLEQLNKALNDETQRFRAHKMQVNLEFPVDRLLQFITQYNAHIDQGAKFYEKFAIMLDSYENEKQCATKIPLEYQTLKENIQISIQKFNTAYKPVEINGSKMKQILYGINEYDQ